MSSGREELRRGVRDLIRIASAELEALEERTLPDPPVLTRPRGPGAAGSVPAASVGAAAARGPATDAPPRDPAPDATGDRSPVGAARGAPPREVREIPAREVRSILRLVRDVPPEVAPAPVVPPETAGTPGKKGVCAAYYISRRCWEVPDAYCNTALHVCMLRDCPVYHLNREEMEQRFAQKYSHLW